MYRCYRISRFQVCIVTVGLMVFKEFVCCTQMNGVCYTVMVSMWMWNDEIATNVCTHANFVQM